MTKKVKHGFTNHKKKVVRIPVKSDNERIVWTFESVDRDGKFAFDPDREDFNINLVFRKLISYASMTWSDIKAQTHDFGKSKHHFLEPDKLSNEAQKRIQARHLEESADSIFSFSLNNIVRVIGIRDGRFFRVVWYDPKHEFCPSTLKHT